MTVKNLRDLPVLLAVVLTLFLGCDPGGPEEYPPGSPGSPAASTPEPAVVTGAPPGQFEAGPGEPSQGKWRKARRMSLAEEEAAGLRAVPYLQGYKEAEDRPVVVEHDPAAVFERRDGLNLVVSGHAAEATLVDMRGKVLHRWRHPLRRLWPDLADDPGAAKLEYWRRVHLFPNGDLLGIYEGLGIVKVNARSQVLWSLRGGFHHDLEVRENGEIWVLDREGKLLPRIHPTEGVLEDFVTVLSPGGKVLRKISLLECFERAGDPEIKGLLARRPASGDIFHTNTLEILDGRFADRHPAFRRGNLLLSVLKLDALAIVDPEQGKVVWARAGSWRKQHQPTFLPDGNLLLFDNVGLGRDLSRVMEIDPLTGRTVWEYGGRGVDFSSRTMGSCQRLANGNTLITESENGRAVEVTRDGRTVWEFYNPARAGDGGELVAVLFEVVRLPGDFPFRGLIR